MTKVEQFKKRNRRRNKHLYKKGLLEGYDYIICPMSNERLSMIKSSYIVKVLGITVEEYDKRFPGQPKFCGKRGENLSKGLKRINPATGIRRAVEIQKKARKNLTKVDDDGLTGDERRAIKTRKSNLRNIVDGKNGYQRTVNTRRDTILDNGLSIFDNGLLKNLDKQRKSGRISSWTRKEYWKAYQHLTRNMSAKHKKKEDLHRDHMYSICSGYNNKISPFIISSKHNMQYMTKSENSSKYTNNDISLKDLLLKCGKTKEDNEREWKTTMEVIKYCTKNKTFILPSMITKRLNGQTSKK